MKITLALLLVASVFGLTQAKQWVQFRNRYGKNVDFDGGAKNGARMQQWDGDANNVNQQFYFESGMIYGQNGIAIDVPNYNAQPGQLLQGWQGNPSQWNQQWEVLDNKMFRLKGTNLCWDLKDGDSRNGAGYQLYWCSSGNPNQEFSIVNVGGRSRANSAQGGGNSESFCGYDMISWDQFKQLHPVIGNQWFTQAFVDAANQYNLKPQLLAAIALQESSGRPDPGNNGGIMQFTYIPTWRSFAPGEPDSERNNPWKSIMAAGRYIRALLDEKNQDLDASLYEYNGPVPGPGNPNYRQEIRDWLRGIFVQGPGT